MKPIQYRQDLHQLFTAPGKAAEIGVAEGNFSRDMLHWPWKKKYAVTKLYMVDRWAQMPTQKGDASMDPAWHESNYSQVLEKIKNNTRAVILRGDSTDMADQVEDESLTLLYIDGDHSYEGVFKDLRAWTIKVKPGGFVALHDYLNPAYGVQQAVLDFVGDNFKIHVIAEDKDEDAGAYFQIS